MRYLVRYRCGVGDQRTALVVEDAAGAAYLFAGGRVQGPLAGAHAAPRLARRLRRLGRWVPVPTVAPYTLGELQRLVGATPAPPPAARAA